MQKQKPSGVREEMRSVELRNTGKMQFFPGHPQGFKNANGTGPLKYACHKVEPVVAAGAGAGVESHENPPPEASFSEFLPFASCSQGPGNAGLRDPCPT